MKVTPSDVIEGLILLEPPIYADARGFFLESWNQRDFDEVIGQALRFVQDNYSRSHQGVLRGLHLQRQQTQGKLVQVMQGRIFDVVVDLRAGSPTYGRFSAATLDGDHPQLLWIPPGLAHGFLVLSPSADIRYKTTDYYHPASEETLLWSDPELGIPWPTAGLSLQLSEKDRCGKTLSEMCPVDVLP